MNETTKNYGTHQWSVKTDNFIIGCKNDHLQNETTNNFGTREWSVKNINFITGCKNDCKYCGGKINGIRCKITHSMTLKTKW